MILNIWDKIESCKPNLTPKELEIYELLQKDPYSFSAGSAMEIAARYGVAESRLFRFCGFSAFHDSGALFRFSKIGCSIQFHKQVK